MDKKERVVLIGNKPIMSYVTNTAFQLKETNEIILRARGKFISKAVDVSEILRKRFLKEDIPFIKEIKIDTEKYIQNEKEIKVSTIDIILKK